jgi:hypothetical protein
MMSEGLLSVILGIFAQELDFNAAKELEPDNFLPYRDPLKAPTDEALSRPASVEFPPLPCVLTIRRITIHPLRFA